MLEHIDNDTEILLKLNKKMMPNGVLCIYVPAFPILFSIFDKSIGHFRRYRKKDLIYKLEKTGFEILKADYVDSLGFLLVLVLKFSNLIKKTVESDKSFSIYDRFGFPISRILDRLGGKFLFGKNILVVARKS